MIVGVVASSAMLLGCGSRFDLATGADPAEMISSTSTIAESDVETDELTEPSLRLGEPIAVVPDAVDLRVRPGTTQIYIADRLGRIHRLDDGVVLDLSASIVAGVEEGLLGMVFSEDGGALYLNVVSESMTRILEFAVDDDGVIDVESERSILQFEQPYEAHNGGDLHVDDDGMLLIFSGDGGFIADPGRNGQDLDSPLGKILRIDPSPAGDESFGVPGDNPFVDGEGWAPLIWAYGLRNPWRGHLDPLTGDLWIGDVGDIGWEEINVGWGDSGSGRGHNFGWSAFEGPDRLNLDQSAEDHVLPFSAYRHGDGRCSVTAGEVYRGRAIEEIAGWFVFTDFCDGIVRVLEVTPDRRPGREVIVDGAVRYPVSIRSGPDGELLVISIKGAIVPLLPGD